ncbi:hypothetical protein [Leuconostoc mesenteroides]|uniref:hypothetical protein n=1 Tax=Leuconostoc mesenteroides TaxID=1245 RepID=UPI000A0B98D4|nr:hypothetical protein [Leuconostoc mesenteroides]ORI80586.1 hypothetical protein BMS92_04375 [Leuconostoc mesenteroides subsp. mesenteroides]
MDFIKRAGLYLRQKIGRTALITLVMSAIMIFVLAPVSSYKALLFKQRIALKIRQVRRLL